MKNAAHKAPTLVKCIIETPPGKCTPYTTHYITEAAELHPRLRLSFLLITNNNLKTLPEEDSVPQFVD